MKNNDEVDQNNSSLIILGTDGDDFTKYGFVGASVTGISQKEYVSQAQLYYIFNNKKTILVEILIKFLFLIINRFSENTPLSQAKTQLKTTPTKKFHKPLQLTLENKMEIKYKLLQTFSESQDCKRNLTMFDKFILVTRKITINNIDYVINDDNQLDQEKVDSFFVLLPLKIFGLFENKWIQIKNVPMEIGMSTLSEARESLVCTYLN
jgi:hypothetical protein